MADVLNASFTRHEALGVGEGLLAAVQKPGKPKGSLNSLRPLVLLTALRKTLSLVTLERAREKFELYLSAYRMLLLEKGDLHQILFGPIVG